MRNVFLLKLVLLVCLLSLNVPINAGPNQVYGTHWAWINNFNNSAIDGSFGDTTDPSMTVWYNLSAGNLYGYPALIRGWHYGWNPSGDNLFPLQVSNISSAPCTFNYNAGGTSMTGNFAYDLFLRWDNAMGDPQLEIMIWGDNNSWPIGTQTASNVISAGGYTFDLWEGMNSAAGYYVYSFVPGGSIGNGDITVEGNINVDMKVFFNWLQNNRGGDGHYSNSMYLNVVEAGLEITGGNGWAWMNASINATTGINPETTYYKLQNRSSGLFVDGMGRGDYGANCGLWSNSSSYNQQWLIEAESSYVKLKNRATGLYLDGMGLSNNGATAGQWGSSGSYNQQWTQEVSGSYVRFKNRATGLYLDGMGRNVNGSDLGQWANSSSYNQQWALSSLKSATIDEVVKEQPLVTPEVAIVPNPVTDEVINIYLYGMDGTSNIILLDMNGKVMKEMQADATRIKLDVDVQPGIYLIKVTNGSQTIIKKVVVQ